MRTLFHVSANARRNRAAPPRFRRLEVVAEWPEEWRPDTVFVQGERDNAWFAAFVCPCGCRDIVYLNLLPNARPRWDVTRNERGYPTIRPSIARTAKCRAHFIIQEGRVLPCRWEETSDITRAASSVGQQHMLSPDDTFHSGRKKFYEEQYRVTEPIDPWHAYAQDRVHSTTKEWFYQHALSRGGRILNAGSGGSDYGIQEPMTHLDIFESRIAHCAQRLAGDVAAIPAADCSFDCVLCVGSVINYADPVRAIREFSRVLRPGGLLVLEYERSGSFELAIRHGFRRSCRHVRTFYGRVATDLWVYGDGFIDGLLEASDFRLLEQRNFHAASTVVLAATGSPRIASWFTLGDKTLAQWWPLRAIASNRILAVEKFAD